jgi:hypothetical protein
MTKKMFFRLDLPSSDYKIEIFSDGYEEYEKCFADYYANTCINYGQIIKIREGGKVVDKIKRIVWGNPDFDSIDTVNVENSNGIFRERVGRLVRKTKCYSKLKPKLECAIDVFQFYWNFINEFKEKRTPAMIEDIVDQKITWSIFLHASIKYV